MPKVTVKNICPGPRGLHLADGRTRYLAPGEVAHGLSMESHEIEGAKSTGYFEFGKAATDAHEVEPPTAPARIYEAKHRGGGHYSIMRGDAEVKPGLTKEDAEAFNELTADEQAAYVAG